MAEKNIEGRAGLDTHVVNGRGMGGGLLLIATKWTTATAVVKAERDDSDGKLKADSRYHHSPSASTSRATHTLEQCHLDHPDHSGTASSIHWHTFQHL